MSTVISTVIRPDILTMARYGVPDAEGLIKLNAMENPFPLPASLAVELGHRLSQVALNRYPASRPASLIEKLKRTLAIPSDGEVEVLLGNGSDELIHLISIACAKSGAKVLAPVPSFVIVEMSARFAQLEFIGVPLRADLTLDPQAMMTAIEQHQPAVIFLAYPNNPTGRLPEDQTVEAILRAARKSLVVIDEAYHPFAQRTWLPRIGEFDNLLVMRTFSKWGLAGIRLGYLAGPAAWLTQLDKVRPPYNVNALTQTTAAFLLDHLPVFNEQAAQICHERERLANAIARLSGTTGYPSAANFLLVRVPNAPSIFDALLAKRLLVKNVSAMHPLLTHCLRITVGLPEENELLLEALTEALR